MPDLQNLFRENWEGALIIWANWRLPLHSSEHVLYPLGTMIPRPSLKYWENLHHLLGHLSASDTWAIIEGAITEKVGHVRYH